MLKEKTARTPLPRLLTSIASQQSGSTSRPAPEDKKLDFVYNSMGKRSGKGIILLKNSKNRTVTKNHPL
jgi:hypothetical protein